MFGLFKKRITPEGFGGIVIRWANEFLEGDCGRSLGILFDDSDGSGGRTKFLERKGISVAKQHVYHRLFTHCAIQAPCIRLRRL
jgi:hypothetical protein